MILRPAAAVLALAAVLGGCVSSPRQEPRSSAARLPTYTVRSGDTLSGIATRLRVDMVALARTNRINPPYLIRVGQQLAIPNAPLAQAPIRPPAPRPAPAPVQSLPPVAAAQPARPAPHLPPPPGAPRLVWPADGPVRGDIGSSGETRGIVIAAHQGVAVRSAAAGTVASVSQHPLFGRFVIVDHGNSWLTGYGHLGMLVVSPGERVAAGARLGFVGPPSPGAQARLHFELRQGERFYDPLPVLPPRF